MRVHFVVAVALCAAVPACKKKPEPEPQQPNAPQPATPRPKPPTPKGPTEPDSGAPKPPLNFAIATQRDLETRNNLRKISLALFSAEVVHGRIPFAIADKTGKPGLSWRVAILPHLEQEALYKQFKLDEPWDSPNNIKLADPMPKVFAAPGTTGRYTFYRAFTGPNTAFPSAGPANPGAPILGANLALIPDGSASTLLMAEAFEPVVWTKPEELAFDPKRLPKLGGVYADGFHALLCDGSFRFVRKTVSDQTLSAAIGTNDGQIVDFSK